MRIYMKIAGYDGPVTYDKTNGWIEVVDALVVSNTDSGRPGVRVMRRSDTFTLRLMHDSANGIRRNVTIVWVKDAGRPPFELARPRMEYARVRLTEAAIVEFRVNPGLKGVEPVEAFACVGAGTPVTGIAHASQPVRREDRWTVKPRACGKQVAALV